MPVSQGGLGRPGSWAYGVPHSPALKLRRGPKEELGVRRRESPRPKARGRGFPQGPAGTRPREGKRREAGRRPQEPGAAGATCFAGKQLWRGRAPTCGGITRSWPGLCTSQMSSSTACCGRWTPTRGGPRTTPAAQAAHRTAASPRARAESPGRDAVLGPGAASAAGSFPPVSNPPPPRAAQASRPRAPPGQGRIHLLGGRGRAPGRRASLPLLLPAPLRPAPRRRPVAASPPRPPPGPRDFLSGGFPPQARSTAEPRRTPAVARQPSLPGGKALPVKKIN